MNLEGCGTISSAYHQDTEEKLTQREGEVTGVVLLHVDVETTSTRHLLQFTLWARRAAEVIQTTDDTEHSSKSNLASFLAETGVRAETILDVGVHWAVEVDFVGVGEDGCVAVGFDL